MAVHLRRPRGRVRRRPRHQRNRGTVDEALFPVAYDKLEAALLGIVRKFNFENFLMTIRSAGFISPKMIGSKNTLNFAYALYLRLRADFDDGNSSDPPFVSDSWDEDGEMICRMMK